MQPRLHVTWSLMVCLQNQMQNTCGTHVTEYSELDFEERSSLVPYLPRVCEALGLIPSESGQVSQKLKALPWLHNELGANLGYMGLRLKQNTNQALG